MVALLCAILAGALAGFLPWNFHPAKVFIGTTGVFMAGLRAGDPLDPRERRRSRSRCSSSACRSSTRSGSSRAGWRRAARRSRPTAGTSTIGSSTSGLTHRGAVLLIYAICTLLAVASLLLTGSGPAVRVHGHRRRLRAACCTCSRAARAATVRSRRARTPTTRPPLATRARERAALERGPGRRRRRGRSRRRGTRREPGLRGSPVAGCYTPDALPRVPMDGHGKAFAYFALFTEIGLVLFVTTLGGALAGRWLDERLATSHSSWSWGSWPAPCSGPWRTGASSAGSW